MKLSITTCLQVFSRVVLDRIHNYSDICFKLWLDYVIGQNDYVGRGVAPMRPLNQTQG